MAPTAETLFDLFGDFTSAWPATRVREHTGHEVGPTPSPAVWLAKLNNSVKVGNVRTGALGDRVAVEAELTVDPDAGFLGYDGWPFVLVSMPDVEFRVRPYAASGRFARLLASAGDTGLELVLEQLPVEIRLPGELLEPHPDEPGGPAVVTEIAVGSFTPGNLDDLQVVYRRGNPSSILVHVRLLMTEAGEFHIQPAVPVSFGRCALSAIPCKAVHDFRLIPSPDLVPDHYEWVRHSVTPWLPSMTGAYDGLFAARSIEIDESAEAMQDVLETLNRRAGPPNRDPTAEFVLDDAVVPFLGPLFLPVPRHLTAGVRRRVLNPNDIAEVFAFEQAPVHVRITEDPAIAFILESLFYRSQPSETVKEDLGLTFSAAIVFGADASPQHAFEFGLEEDYTLVVGYRRDFSTTTGLPAPGTGAPAVINALLHWEIAGAVIVDIMGFRGGFSLGRKFGADKSIGDSLLLTADLFVSMPPTGADDAIFRLRGLNGEKVAFAIEGLGWRLGSFHLEGVAMPDGVVAFIGPVGVIIAELGLVAEDGASYFSFSGGLMIEVPSGFKGGMTVRRMRFRVAGNTSRPAFKLDGFFLFLRSPTVQIEAGGYYTDQTVAGTRVREFGLTGTVGFKCGIRDYVVGLDLIVGNQAPAAGTDFDYLMAQAFFRGQLGPIGYFELTGARLLYGRNMLPKLGAVDRESRDLRYYSWYKGSNPLTVPGDRRLASWRADRGSWAFGVGAGASLAGLGKVIELSVFVLGLGGPTEDGFLIVGEVYVLSGTQPLGFLAIEWDGRNDRFSLVVGVDMRIGTFVPSAPAWMSNAGKLTGTLFICNDPGTFAIGRLADQKTWLGLRFDVNWFVRTFVLFGACLEIVEGPTGPKGFGLVVRVEGGINLGVARMTYNAGIGFTVMVFSTASSDFAVVIWIEAGLRFVLFGFLRLGLSARADFRMVGRRPARGELSVELRLETPWFLPDVTWRFEIVFGTLAPADLATAVQPLRSAGANEAATRKQLPAHIERFDPAWNGEGVAPLHTVNELRAPTRPEATRLANVAADTALRPVATDATVAITFSVAINDRLALGSGMATGLGDQRSGDLDLSYELVGLAVRRRARFGVDRSWKPLEQAVELTADFSDPAGVKLNGSFAPQVLHKTWDLDVRVGGEPAPKKLLINAVAPYEFQTTNAETDEELVAQQPSWPCCRGADEKDLFSRLHEIEFRERVNGTPLTTPLKFSDSQSTLRFLREAWVHPALTPGVPAATPVAAVEVRLPGPMCRAALVEDAAYCWVRVAWPRNGRVTLVAFDAHGREAGRTTSGSGTGAHEVLMVAGNAPIRSFEVRAFAPFEGLVTHIPDDSLAGVIVEIDWLAYLSLRDVLDSLVADEVCDGGTPGGPVGYEGKGKLAFLPNHEYEIALNTRVSVTHPSTAPPPAKVEEFVYVRTKGLPGLNAVARTGEELEPYVRGAYAGGRGLVYRAEPVTLAFAEDFFVAVPLTLRPPGTSLEHVTLLRMQLLVTPDVATETGTAFTSTARDWVTDHRSVVVLPEGGPWFWVASASASRGSAMITTDPLKHRLAEMTQRPEVTCELADPRRVVGTVLVAPPQGTPDPAASPPGSSELWAGGAHFTATVRAEGAGFVDRRPFLDGDQTAFAFATASGPGGAGAWSVTDGKLRVTGAGVRRFAAFGEATWDHLVAVVGVVPGAASAGIGFGLPATGGAPRGLFALVETTGPTARLVIRRRLSGGALSELAAATLPASATDGGGPIALEVTSFDDRLRAAVGDRVVEAEREDIREGRLCLTGDGPATFTSLQVRGLDMHRFPFATSRFRSFAEHVRSWRGVVDPVLPDALGPGTTTSTVSALWTATASEVTAVMDPAADPAVREALFARWTRELGLPFKDDVTELELSRVVEGGRTRAILVESPEPMDFTAEVTASLVHRKRVIGFPPFEPPLHLRPRPFDPIAITGRAEHLGLAVAHGGEAGTPATAIRDAIRGDGDIRLELAPGLARLREVAVATVEDDGSVVVHRGRVKKPAAPGAPAVVDAGLGSPLARPPRDGGALADALASAPPGAVIVLDPGLEVVHGKFELTFEDVDVTVAVLQSGDARRALVVPAGMAGATALDPGRHRLTLSLVRRRWETTDAEDALNTYRSSATLSMVL